MNILDICRQEITLAQHDGNGLVEIIGKLVLSVDTDGKLCGLTMVEGAPIPHPSAAATAAHLAPGRHDAYPHTEPVDGVASAGPSPDQNAPISADAPPTPNEHPQYRV